MILIGSLFLAAYRLNFNKNGGFKIIVLRNTHKMVYKCCLMGIFMRY